MHTYMHSMSKERGITFGIRVVLCVTCVIQHGVLHDVVSGAVVGVNQGILHVDYGVRVATKSVCCDISRQLHVDFNFVPTSENLLLWPLCIEYEEQNGEKKKTDMEEKETMILSLRRKVKAKKKSNNKNNNNDSHNNNKNNDINDDRNNENDDGNNQ